MTINKLQLKLNINDFFLSIFLSGTIAFYLLTMIAPSYPLMLSLIFVILTTIFWSCIHERIILPAFCIIQTSLFFLCLLFFHSKLIEGMILLWNLAAHTIGTHSTLYLPVYQTILPKQQNTVCLSMLLFFFFFTISFISNRVAKQRNVFLYLLLLFPLFVFQLLFHIQLSFLLVVAVIVSIFLLRIAKLLSPSEMNSRFLKQLLLYIQQLFLLALLGLLTFHISGKLSLVSLQQEILSSISNFIYDNTLDPLSEGKLSVIQSQSRSKDSALSITMEHPSSMYLKGFIGSVYEHDHWTDLSYQERYENNNLFYWMKEDGFLPASQLSLIHALEQDRKVSSLSSNTTISIKGANKRYFYLPYELSSIQHPEINESALIQNEGFQAKNLKRISNYTFCASSSLVPNYPDIAAKLQEQEAAPSKKLKQYLSDESYYNIFVYKTYCQIPENTRILLKNHLGDVSIKKHSHFSYSSAVDHVRSYLKEHITYSTKKWVLPAQKDFLAYFLEEKPSGYSVQYATAATLMFRYLGIPARYVEGYLVTPENIKGLSDHSTIDIKKSNAHAWVEIYQDGVGFVPIEVTPPYYHVMEQPKAGKLTQEIQSVRQSQKNQSTQNIYHDDPLNLPHEVKLPDSLIDYLQYLRMLVALILIILLGLFFYLQLKKWHTLRVWKRQFHDSDSNCAAIAMFEYVKILLPQITYHSPSDQALLTAEYQEYYENMYALYEKALYSKHSLSPEELTSMVHFLNETIVLLIHHSSLFKRIKHRYYDFLY
ncbi:transglutaminase-like enzymes, putative cysteine proteases [Lachnospiraceae bacterium KM106-2]|nr:transglutaminase-like enzymes, putative cysteine proteases [Lachnospiraceae bacterium KM106-2]